MFERITKLFDKQESKQAPYPQSQSYFMSADGADFSPQRYTSFASEGYMQNVIAYRVISDIAYQVASVPYEIVDAAGEVIENTDNSKFAKRLKYPNIEMDYCEFVQWFISYRLLDGQAFMSTNKEAGSNKVVDKDPKAIYNIRPDLVEVKRDREGRLKRFNINVGGNVVQYADVNQLDGVSGILQLKDFNPLSIDRGFSPMAAAGFSIDVFNEIQKFAKSTFQNKGFLAGILNVKQPMDDNQFSAFLSDFKASYTGTKKAGKNFLTNADEVTYTKMASEPDKIGYEETARSKAREIAMAFNYPPLLLGLPGDNTYANYAEARLGLVENTVVPLLKELSTAFNDWLSPMYGGTEFMRPNYNKIDVLADKWMRKWEALNPLTFMTIEEKREYAGLEREIPADETFLISSNQIPLTDFSVQEQEKNAAFVELINSGYGVEEAKSLIEEVEIKESLSDDERTPPKTAKNNAQRVLDWKDEHGDDVKGMTSVGWNRARQLSKGGALSESVIKKMAQFNRHRDNGKLDSDKKDKPWTDAGYVAWLGWGGSAGVDWAIRVSGKMVEKSGGDKENSIESKMLEKAKELLGDG